MLEKDVEERQMPEKAPQPAATVQQTSPVLPVLLCIAAFLLCTLLSLAPLQRVAGFTMNIGISKYLPLLGAWLPRDIGLNKSNHFFSQVDTGNIEFLLLLTLAFGAYGLCALFIQRGGKQSEDPRLLRLIWSGTVLVGCIYLFTPALLSHDLFVYAGYGRLLVVHQANPYFVVPSTYQDPLNPLNDWKNAVAAYGPLWLAVCSLVAAIANTHILLYILSFRLLAFAAHLVNTWLVTTTLRTMGRSPRVVTLGTLLYALNPLVLLESCLNAHNDIYMITLMLFGILFSVRAGCDGLIRLRGYALPLLTFTLAALIKFTTAPILVVFAIFLAWNKLHAASPASQQRVARWVSALRIVVSASMISGMIALVIYAPFWINHSIQDIKGSFTSPPSATAAKHSILAAIVERNNVYGLPTSSWLHTLYYVLSLHSIWVAINIVTLAGAFIIGAAWLWHKRTTSTFILATLAALGALLVVTPWFYPWYVTWLVALAAVGLSTMHERIGRALVAFALTFSASAPLVYLFNGYPPISPWIGHIFFTTIGPPLLAFLIFIVQWSPTHPVAEGKAAVEASYRYTQRLRG
jgi:hypothetical protein